MIFVALAVAWAVYLIPKALLHNPEQSTNQTVDRFSHRLRVLARRDTVDGKSAQLMVTSPRASTVETPAPAVIPTTAPPPTRADLLRRRAAAHRATARRRRVLTGLLFANLAVAIAAATQTIAWWYAAIPAVLLLGWLVACRTMVKGERAAWDRLTASVELTASVQKGTAVSDHTPVLAGDAPTDGETPSASPAAAAPATGDPELTSEIVIADAGLWDPLPMTLPTYVTKEPAARRAVRTIDLDSTGVWSSGRSAADSELARTAEEAERAAKATKATQDGDRAVGS